MIVAIDVGDARGHVVHDEPQLRFGRAQGFLSLLQPVNVVHEDERARHLAGRCCVRHDADRHPAGDAVRSGHQPVELGRLPVEGARHDRLRAFVDVGTDDVVHSKRGDRLGGQPEVLQERAVDVLAALVAIDVGDRRGHAVHDRSQLTLARGERVLRDLEIGDVVADDVDALDRPVDPVVRHHAAADPARAARRIGEFALEADRLARERAVVVGRDRVHRRDALHFGRATCRSPPSGSAD